MYGDIIYDRRTGSGSTHIDNSARGNHRGVVVVQSVALAGFKTGLKRTEVVGLNKCLAGQLAPQVFRQTRVVDERVAVALNRLHSVVAVDLFLRNGILTVPFHQQRDRVVGHT